MKDGLRFFAPDCKQHNPYVSGGMDTLMESMASAVKEMGPKSPDAEFKVANVVAEGDTVVVHTNLVGSRTKPELGGLRQAHVFRFNENKIVEYWDITQTITPDMPNARNAF